MHRIGKSQIRLNLVDLFMEMEENILQLLM